MIPLFFALLLIQEPQPADKKWTLKGTVVDTLTGEPLGKAIVTLQGSPSGYSAITDAEGKFSIQGTEPSEFDIYASRQGFIGFHDSRKLKIAEGHDVKDMAIKLTPQCALAGHVVDEDGDPIASGVVIVTRIIAGHEGTAQMTELNADGYFLMVGLSAGRYIVAASNVRFALFGPSLPHSAVDYVRTYYPNSLTAANSIPVVLTAGMQNRGVDIRLRKERVFRVRGRVTNLPKDYLGISLNSGKGDQADDAFTQLEPDGKFEFTRVLPGEYVLRMTQIPEATMFSRVPIAVGRDIDDLTVDLSPGATITGSLKMEGSAAPPAHWPIIHVAGADSSPDSSIKEDGTFTWSNVPPDIYKTWLTPGASVFLKSLRFNGQPISTTVWDLTTGAGGSLEILLSPNVAEISGAVRDQDGAPVAAKLVTLWRTGEEPRSAPSNADGRFRFAGLAPGQYRLLAWEEIDDNRAAIPEFIEQFKAIEVKLEEGSKENLDLKVVPKLAIDEAAAKLP